MESPTVKDPAIEEVLARMESIVSRLERQDTDLEEAMALYAEGVRLARETGERLRAAELRITELRADLESHGIPEEPA